MDSVHCLFDLLDRNFDIKSITVVDIFDPQVVINQLKAINEKMEAWGGKESESYIATISFLEKLLSKNKIKVVSAQIGVDELSGKFDRIVNIAGPKINSAELSKLLNPNGKVISNYKS